MLHLFDTSFQVIGGYSRISTLGCVILLSQDIGWYSLLVRVTKHVVLPVVYKQVPPSPDQPSERDDIFLENLTFAVREKGYFKLCTIQYMVLYDRPSSTLHENLPMLSE